MSDPTSEASDPLPLLNDGPAKRAILEFVATVTDPTDERFVAPADRLACFDNDGTLWCEQPVPIQAFFMRDRIVELAETHPSMRHESPFDAVLERDLDAMREWGLDELSTLAGRANAIDDTADFGSIVDHWMRTTRHPRFDQPFDRLTFAPMVEVVRLLRANEFTVFLNSAGSTEFMRAVADRLYGVPTQQVLGTRMTTKVRHDDDGYSVERLPTLAHYNDKEAKIETIDEFIGRPPIVVFGNSDGDIALMEYASEQPGPTLMVLLDHTDATREYRYDEHTITGRLVAGRPVAAERGWTILDMERDFRTVFAWEAEDPA